MTEQETNDNLAIIPEESAIFQSIRTSSALTQADVAFQVENFTDLELTSYIRDCCHVLHRVMTTPAAAELIARFQAAKAQNRKYCDFSNFDKMCPALTGFSSRQIRNYAAGYATPPKAVAKITTPKTPEEVEFDKAADALEARTQAAIAEFKRQAKLNEDARIAAKGGAEKVMQAAAEIILPVAPVTLKTDKNPVAAKTQQLLEVAVQHINALLRALPAGGLSKEDKEVKKKAIAFLDNNFGGVEDAPFLDKAKAAEAA